MESSLLLFYWPPIEPEINRTIIEESPFSQLLFGRKRCLHFNVEAGNSPLSVALSLYLSSLQASKLEEGKYAVKWVEEGEDCERMRERGTPEEMSSVASKSNLLQVELPLKVGNRSIRKPA